MAYRHNESGGVPDLISRASPTLIELAPLSMTKVSRAVPLILTCDLLNYYQTLLILNGCKKN